MSRSVLENRSFVYIWIGNGVSELGGAFGTFCNSILIYQLTNSTMALGSMWLLYFLRSLVLQLFIGPFIDRWSRKWMMIFSQWTRGLIFIVPLTALALGNIEPWHIYVVQIMIGLITPIYTPANQAIIPTIVTKDQLNSANAYIEGTVRLMTFLAPIVGGVVVEYVGVQPTYIFVSAVLIISGSLLLFINEVRVKEDVRRTWLEQFIEGFSYFFKTPIIVWLGIFLAFVQFGVGVTMVITLPYITEELVGSYSDYGYFMASFPLGYVIGSILVGRLAYKNRRVIMLGALVIGGLTFISLGINNSIVMAIITEMIAGIAMAFFSVQNITLFQQIVPNNMMGKVSSVRLFIIRGAMPVGVVVGSFLGELWGIRPLYLMIGSIICTMSILGMCLPYFRFINSEIRENAVS